MPRRTWTYSAELNVASFNQMSTVGAVIFGISGLVWVWALVRSLKHGAPAGPNPWNAPTLEWATPSPPHHYNFPDLPRVRRREPLWKDGDREELLASTLSEPKQEPVMPNGSFWPIVTAFGSAVTWILVMTGKWWAPLLGLAFTAFGVFNWAFEDPFEGKHHS